MNKFPILNINQFKIEKGKEDLYASILSEHLVVHDATINKPHKHDFYLIVLFTKGVGVHEIDFKTHPVKEGALFLIKPGQTHYWKFSEKAEGYIFFHSKSFYDFHFPNKGIDNYPFFYSWFNASALYLNKSDAVNFIDLFKKIIEENTAKELFGVQKISLLIDSLYIDTTRLFMRLADFKIDANKKRISHFNELERLIESNYLAEKRPKFYAEKLNVSIKHLNKIVNTTVGKSTSELVQERIVLEAKRLLVHGNYTSQEIAFTLGFDDPSYFSRIFKKKCGFSPTEFVKKYE
ncbi:MAG: helix-turn-helix transcriptional regulator [Flavobacteriales bacterium]|nr:helix-turn-helix transcriptional regulator [Flavobacteriales bacterium]